MAGRQAGGLKAERDGLAERFRTAVTDLAAEAEARKAAVAAVETLSKDVGIPARLSEVGVKAEDIPALAEAAFADVCTGGNPRDTSIPDIEALYRSIL